MAKPPAHADVVVLVGGQADDAAAWFKSCRIIAELDNAVGVDNEEQGQPVMVCENPVEPWPQLWQRFRHLR